MITCQQAQHLFDAYENGEPSSEKDGGDWQGAIAAAARHHREQIEAVLAAR